MGRLSYKEMSSILEDVGEIAPKSSVHIHHCKEGRDNDRMYITNAEDAYLFYCHHCGASGSLRITNSAYKKHKAGLKHDSITHSSSIYLPSDTISDPTQWPVQASVWPSKAHLSYDEVGAMGMSYSPSKRRVYVPITFEGEYQGYTARKIFPEDPGPKYLSRMKDKSTFIYSCQANNDPQVVLVEDILSARRLYLCGYNSVAVQGVNITDKLLSHLISRYKQFVIWLDDDRREVKMAQAKLKARLGLFGEVRMLKTEHDPKTYTDEEIKAHVSSVE